MIYFIHSKLNVLPAANLIKKVPNYRMKSCQLSIKKSLRTKDYLYPKAWDRHPQPWDMCPQPWDMCPQPANKDYRFIRSI